MRFLSGYVDEASVPQFLKGCEDCLALYTDKLCYLGLACFQAVLVAVNINCNEREQGCRREVLIEEVLQFRPPLRLLRHQPKRHSIHGPDDRFQ